MTNMNLYNSAGRITKYDTVNEILNEFYLIRLSFYTKRREYMLNKKASRSSTVSTAYDNLRECKKKERTTLA